jgi:hypothetical protein
MSCCNKVATKLLWVALERDCIYDELNFLQLMQLVQLQMVIAIQKTKLQT